MHGNNVPWRLKKILVLKPHAVPFEVKKNLYNCMTGRTLVLSWESGPALATPPVEKLIQFGGHCYDREIRHISEIAARWKPYLD